MARIHMVGNAHIDPVWIWDWREGMHEVLQTFAAALDRLEEFPDLYFTASSAAYYRWVELTDPALLGRIRQQVADGRWIVTGGQWIEPDCNLPSGESVCRQFLYGQRALRDTVGVTASVGYNIDSFGHGAGLPQLLALGGLTGYVMMRPDDSEKDLPARAFGWQGADGTVIPAYRIPFDYSTRGGPEEDLLRSRVDDLLAGKVSGPAQDGPLMCFFGVGDHGGGPTRRAIATIRALAEETGGEVAFSDPARYFAALEAAAPRLPLVQGELQHHAVGCYSAYSAAKRGNGQAERALVTAELMTSMARVLTRLRPDSTRQLAAAWEQVLFNQFHDALGGTCAVHAYPALEAMTGQALATADRLTTLAAHAIGQRIDTWLPGAETAEGIESAIEGLPVPLIVFNPAAEPLRQVITLPHPVTVATDAAGVRVPVQQVPSGEVTYSPTGAMLPVTAPPLGYQVYLLQVFEPPDGSAGPPPGNTLTASTAELANGLIKVTLDEPTGAITGLTDVATGRQLIGPGGVRLTVLDDASDTWSHGVHYYDGTPQPSELVDATVVEHGPVRAAIRLRLRTGRSDLTAQVRCYAGERFAEVALDVDWRDQARLLKLVVPVAVTGPRCAAGAAYASIERPSDSGEEVMQHWVDLWGTAADGATAGLACTTDFGYGYDASGGQLRLTVLRSPRFADHGRGWAGEDACGYPFTEQGRHSASYRLHPHEGGWADAGVPRQARGHLAQLPYLLDTWHRGELGRACSLLTVAAGSVTVPVLKRAEDGSGWVLRVFEYSGQATTARVELTFCGRVYECDLRPHQLVTLHVPDDEAGPISEIGLAEFGPLA